MSKNRKIILSKEQWGLGLASATIVSINEEDKLIDIRKWNCHDFVAKTYTIRTNEGIELTFAEITKLEQVLYRYKKDLLVAAFQKERVIKGDKK